MIYYLKGGLKRKKSKFAVIEVAGVGYKVFCSLPVLEKLPEAGSEVQLYTFLHLKEDEEELYGFLEEAELELFETLNGISGIGPRTALDLSVFGSLENLKAEIEKGKFDQKVKGIGRKKMQKILLELTGKIKESAQATVPEKEDEALDTLVSLGFSKQKSREALSKILPGSKNSEERVKEALKILGGAGKTLQ